MQITRICMPGEGRPWLSPDERLAAEPSVNGTGIHITQDQGRSGYAGNHHPSGNDLAGQKNLRGEPQHESGDRERAR
jgi:hypothetical protein